MSGSQTISYSLGTGVRFQRVDWSWGGADHWSVGNAEVKSAWNTYSLPYAFITLN
jgi:hypothetical protein